MAHWLIEKLLRKRGIESTDKLAEHEKPTFDGWQRILSEGTITVDKIQEFCRAQLSLIHGKFKEDNSNEKNNKLIAMHNVYKSILDVIDKPKIEKEQLEKYLHDLIEKS